MPKPIAAFTFSDDLAGTVSFRDGSSNSPTSWSWEFGDDTPDPSTEQHPTHTYTEGVYLVKFTATNADGSDTIQYQIVVSLGQAVVPSILQMVKSDLPEGLIITDQSILNSMRSYMSTFYTADNIIPSEAFKEEKYRIITRMLIARLIIYDYITNKAQAGLMSMGSSSKGGLKSIEAGPSKTEWYDATDSWKKALSTGGSIDLLNSNICLLAAQVGIQLPMCPIQEHVIAPKVFYGFTKRCR